MAQHNVYTYYSVWNCLDAEFDEPDAAADHELCCAIVAGRMGLHPDGWGAHDPLSTLPAWIRAWEPKSYERVYHPSPADLKAARHWPRPVEEPKPKPPRKPRPAWHLTYTGPGFPTIGGSPPDAPAHGELQLTCDVCHRARFNITLDYRGDRPRKTEEIRALGHNEGWTHITGIDRCPKCSQVEVEWE